MRYYLFTYRGRNVLPLPCIALRFGYRDITGRTYAAVFFETPFTRTQHYFFFRCPYFGRKA